jgi:hypothetical protein
VYELGPSLSDPPPCACDLNTMLSIQIPKDLCSCLSDLPYITFVLDLNVALDPQPKFLSMGLCFQNEQHYVPIPSTSKHCGRAAKTSLSLEKRTVRGASPSPRHIQEYYQVAQLELVVGLGGIARISMRTIDT